jgi:meso-butanediol dehydrogenase / (S,S)-butanediol dehydrogenase / diacetyl reductase
MANTLEGKVALVTGAGGEHGIGRAIAVDLAKHGADVVVSDVQQRPRTIPTDESTGTEEWQGLPSVRDEILAMGRRSEARLCDLSDEAQIAELMDSVVESFGHIDIVVNNARAALGGDLVPVVELDAAEWDRVMVINLRGFMLSCKHALRHLIAADRGGRIINVSSISGRQGTASMAAYCTSKFGVIGLTQSIAMEVADQGITANCVCPGSVATDRFSPVEWEASQAEGISYQAYRERQNLERGSKIPIQRVGTPGEIASAVTFLASPGAAFVTGHALDANGGVWMG